MIDLICTCRRDPEADWLLIVSPDCPVHGNDESGETDICGGCGAEYSTTDGHSCEPSGSDELDDPRGEYPPFQPQETEE
jgi:hypothetical protein